MARTLGSSKGPREFSSPAGEHASGDRPKGLTDPGDKTRLLRASPAEHIRQFVHLVTKTVPGVASPELIHRVWTQARRRESTQPAGCNGAQAAAEWRRLRAHNPGALKYRVYPAKQLVAPVAGEARRSRAVRVIFETRYVGICDESANGSSYMSARLGNHLERMFGGRCTTPYVSVPRCLATAAACFPFIIASFMETDREGAYWDAGSATCMSATTLDESIPTGKERRRGGTSATIRRFTAFAQELIKAPSAASSFGFPEKTRGPWPRRANVFERPISNKLRRLIPAEP